MQCPKCGQQNPEGSILCNNCACSFLDFDYEKDIEVLDDFLTTQMLESVNTQVSDSQNITSAYAEQLLQPNSQVNENNISNLETTQTSTPNGINQVTSIKKVLEVETQPQNIVVPVSNQVPNNSFNVEDLAQKPVIEKVEKTPLIEEEELTKFQVLGRITLGGLALMCILLTTYVLTRLSKITLFKKCNANLAKVIGDNSFNLIIIFILYLLLIVLLSYDSYKTKKSTISKETTKSVILSLILAVLSVFIIEGISGLKKTATYVYAILRFMVIVLLLLGNVKFRNLYVKFEEKSKTKTMLFEFLIYYNIITLLILIFSKI